MAFRSETKAGVGLILACALALPLCAQVTTVETRQGKLRIDANSIVFKERGKHPKRSRTWAYDDIQQLVLGPDSLRIVSYEDHRWIPGRERVWTFEHLPATVAAEWYPVLSKKLDRRFVAALADDRVKPEWQVPAKLVHFRNGSQGVLLAGRDFIVYKSAQPLESRTWRITDIQNVTSSDPFDLTIATHERDFRFQLKQTMPGARFDELWRRVNRSNGLQILGEKQ